MSDLCAIHSRPYVDFALRRAGEQGSGAASRWNQGSSLRYTVCTFLSGTQQTCIGRCGTAGLRLRGGLNGCQVCKSGLQASVSVSQRGSALCFSRSSVFLPRNDVLVAVSRLRGDADSSLSDGHRSSCGFENKFREERVHSLPELVPRGLGGVLLPSMRAIYRRQLSPVSPYRCRRGPSVHAATPCFRSGGDHRRQRRRPTWHLNCFPIRFVARFNWWKRGDVPVTSYVVLRR